MSTAQDFVFAKENTTFSIDMEEPENDCLGSRVLEGFGGFGARRVHRRAFARKP